MSPSFASTQGGRCAWTLLLLLSYLLYFLTFWSSSLWITTVCLLEIETMVPTSIFPLTLRCPWNGQRTSSHPRFGGARSRPAVLIWTASHPFSRVSRRRRSCLRAFPSGRRPEG